MQSEQLLERTGFEPSEVQREAFAYYRRLARVQHFVVDHYAGPIALADVAAVARMEKTAFSDFFHRKTGVCFRDWLAAYRVGKAMELMIDSNLPVRKVASECGFGTVRTLERIFLRVTGQTAADYKRSVRPC